MSCEHRDELLELLYDEVEPERAEELRREIRGCAACRPELERLEAAKQLADALPLEPMPARARAAILAAAEEAAAERRGPPEGVVVRLFRSRVWPMVAMAAVALLVVVVGVSYSPEEEAAELNRMLPEADLAAPPERAPRAPEGADGIEPSGDTLGAEATDRRKDELGLRGREEQAETTAAAGGGGDVAPSDPGARTLTIEPRAASERAASRSRRPGSASSAAAPPPRSRADTPTAAPPRPRPRGDRPTGPTPARVDVRTRAPSRSGALAGLEEDAWGVRAQRASRRRSAAPTPSGAAEADSVAAETEALQEEPEPPTSVGGSPGEFMPETLLRLARSHRRRGACAEAVQTYRELRRRFADAPAVPQSLVEEADCLQRLGRVSEAQALLRRATGYRATEAVARRELRRLETQRRAAERAAPAEAAAESY